VPEQAHLSDLDDEAGPDESDDVEDFDSDFDSPDLDESDAAGESLFLLLLAPPSCSEEAAFL